MKKFTADFETATWLPNETYVWAWAICEIGNPDNIIIDNNNHFRLSVLSYQHINDNDCKY